MLMTRHLTVAIDFHSIFYSNQINFLVTDILQNIFFCVQQKKETHTGLEQPEGEEMMTEFSFLGELSPSVALLLWRNYYA